MGGKMKNAPVYLTLAQVKFNPIMSLKSYLSGIQRVLPQARVPGLQEKRRRGIQPVHHRGCRDASRPTVRPLTRSFT